MAGPLALLISSESVLFTFCLNRRVAPLRDTLPAPSPGDYFPSHSCTPGPGRVGGILPVPAPARLLPAFPWEPQLLDFYLPTPTVIVPLLLHSPAVLTTPHHADLGSRFAVFLPITTVAIIPAASTSAWKTQPIGTLLSQTIDLPPLTVQPQPPLPQSSLPELITTRN